jgi:anti-repressor protein
MSEIVPFDFDDHQVRVIVDLEGNPWWVAADVCAVLDISNVSMAVTRLDEADVSSAEVRSGGQDRTMKIVNESGLYDLVLDSRKPAARRFRRWVTSEVIPSIHRTGSYSAAPAIPQTYADALRAYAAEVEAHELANAKVAELEPAAEFHDRFMNSGGLSSMTDLADMFSTSVGKFTGWLVDLGIFRKGEYDQFPGRRMPRKKYQDAGLFEVRIECSDRGVHYPVAYATPEGLVFVRKALQSNGLAD